MCWHSALKGLSACSEGKLLGCCFARFFFLLSQLVGIHESQLMLCRSQFFHHIFSSWGYFSKVPCNPEPLSPQFQAAFFISNSLPNFSRASISMESIIKGPFVPGCAGVFSSRSHLKTLALCMLYSVWSSSACPCLAASETRSTGTP